MPRYACLGDAGIFTEISMELFRKSFRRNSLNFVCDRVNPSDPAFMTAHGMASTAKLHMRLSEYDGIIVAAECRHIANEICNRVTPEAQFTRNINFITTDGRMLVGHDTCVKTFARAVSMCDSVHPGMRAVLLGENSLGRAMALVLKAHGLEVKVISPHDNWSIRLLKDIGVGLGLWDDRESCNTPEVLVNTLGQERFVPRAHTKPAWSRPLDPGLCLQVIDTHVGLMGTAMRQFFRTDEIDFMNGNTLTAIKHMSEMDEMVGLEPIPLALAKDVVVTLLRELRPSHNVMIS